MNNLVIGKTMESIRKHQGIKHSTTKKRKNYLVSEPNYDRTKFFSKNSSSSRNEKKTQIFIRKFVYLGFTIF